MRKLMKFFLFFVLLPVGHLFALQDSIPGPNKMKRGVYEDASFIAGNFSRLNDILTQNGFPALRQTYGGISIGFSARQADKGSYFTAKLFFLNTNSPYNAKTDTKGASILTYGLHDEWHLDLAKNAKWRIGPDFGFGFGLVRLKLFERISSPSNFAGTLNPTIVTYNEKKLVSGSLFMTAGAGIDRKFKIGFMDFYFGAGAGYRLTTPTRFIEKYQYNISSPPVRLSGVLYNFRLRIEIRELIHSKKKNGYEFRKFQ